MKTISKITILTSAILVVCITIFNGCSENDTTTPISPAQHDCGTHHTVSYTPLTVYTNTFVSGGTRTFQFSAIPLTTISNICTKTEPSAYARVTWYEDDTRPLTVALKVNVAILQQYSSFGSTTINSNGEKDWSAGINAGLQQSYGEGPGEIIDYRVDISFATLGSDSADLNFLGARILAIESMKMDYDEHLSTDNNTGDQK